MFLFDPSGNAIEFKAFKDPSKLFAKGAPLGGVNCAIPTTLAY